MHCLTWSYKSTGEQLASKHLTSEKNPEHTTKQQENYQLIKMQGVLKLLLVCGILLAVATDTQALSVSHSIK